MKVKCILLGSIPTNQQHQFKCLNKNHDDFAYPKLIFTKGAFMITKTKFVQEMVDLLIF